MQPNNLTALDFEDIKASIKSYLRTRNEFTDYDFDGSSLSYLIDTLAYNSYYTAFNANMAMNEAFLPSATVRDNVVTILTNECVLRDSIDNMEQTKLLNEANENYLKAKDYTDKNLHLTSKLICEAKLRIVKA